MATLVRKLPSAFCRRETNCVASLSSDFRRLHQLGERRGELRGGARYADALLLLLPEPMPITKGSPSTSAKRGAPEYPLFVSFSWAPISRTG